MNVTVPDDHEPVIPESMMKVKAAKYSSGTEAGVETEPELPNKGAILNLTGVLQVAATQLKSTSDDSLVSIKVEKLILTKAKHASLYYYELRAHDELANIRIASAINPCECKITTANEDNRGDVKFNDDAIVEYMSGSGNIFLRLRMLRRIQLTRMERN